MKIDSRALWLARQIIASRENTDGHIVVEMQTASLIEATIFEGGVPVAAKINTYPDHLLEALLGELNVRVTRPKPTGGSNAT